VINVISSDIIICIKKMETRLKMKILQLNSPYRRKDNEEEK